LNGRKQISNGKNEVSKERRQIPNGKNQVLDERR
jgi:hypothetical protein